MYLIFYFISKLIKWIANIISDLNIGKNIVDDSAIFKIAQLQETLQKLLDNHEIVNNNICMQRK